MEGVARKLKRQYFRKAIIYFLTCCLILNTSLPAVLALGSGNVINSSGIIGTPTWGDHTIIDTDHGAIINWNNFNTSGTQSVGFNQYKSGILSSSSAVLNRITSGTVPTEFNGALNANGRVFIVNPAGIIFGAGSAVNATQLVASGLNMSNDAFNAVLDEHSGQMEFTGGNGKVTNSGSIRADSVYLVGSKVNNQGLIIAQNGLIVMAAGDHVFLAQDGSNVAVQLDADPGDTVPDVQNSSIISATGGTVVLAAGDTFSRAILNVGMISALGGTVTVRAARIENNGIVNVSSGADGGSINITGIEEVVFAPDVPTGSAVAEAGPDGNGGTITIESEGTVTIGENARISAAGGSNSGDGGVVKITGEHFSITGGIDASPRNKDYEAGRLEIHAPTVNILDGAGTGTLDTVYEQDFETLSDKGTGLAIYSEKDIVVPDILDGEIKGRFGNIELHATGAGSSVSFEDTSDTISTTLGDIIIEAGGAGIDIGNLQTAKDLSDIQPTPGQISLTTTNGGDITAENLIIKDGWGHAKINIDASGSLTVNGDVVVGRDSAILNVPLTAEAQAIISLSAGNDVVLHGDVRADAHGAHEGAEGGVSKAYIGITSGTNDMLTGDVTINGNLVATAAATDQGTSDATIEIDAWGQVHWGPEAADPVAEAEAWTVRVESKESAIETNEDGDVAQIIVNEQGNVSGLAGLPDLVETQMDNPVEGNVLDNDIDPEGEPLTAKLVDGPLYAKSFTLDSDGSYSYTPQAGYVGTDSFTYTASAGGETTAPVLVTITITNDLPTAIDDMTLATINTATIINVLANDIDPDKDPLKVKSFFYEGAGTLVLNANGTFTYTPPRNFVGQETFTYRTTDGQIGDYVIQATVTVRVGQRPVPPEFFMPAGPGPDKTELRVSGCPALMKWAAKELGVDRKRLEIWSVNGLASARGIQPCDACSGLQTAAAILSDPDGTHIAALAQVINEFASSTAPMSEELASYIANRVARNFAARKDYVLAGEYFGALADYVSILNMQMGFSVEESVQMATEKYVVPLTVSGNEGVASYMAVRLDALSVFLTVLTLNQVN